MRIEYSGGGDPARSLALLWRTQERASRKGNSLSVDRIAQSAIDLVDADGLTALSMRRIAERLGVGTMSLYTHVPGKAELIDVMLDTVYGEVDTTDLPGPWRARLERVAHQNWALFHRHPWMLQIAPGRPVMGPNAIAKYDYELRAIAGIGLTEVEMDSVVTLVAGHVEAAARASVAGDDLARQSGLSDQQWWSSWAPLLEKVFDPHRFPTAARVGVAAGQAFDAPHSPEHALHFGLQRILDGVEALIATRSTDGG